MGVISYDAEITSSIPPAKMFKAFVLDADTIIPKILPQAIKSVQILEGDGGPGTTKLTTFGEAKMLKAFVLDADTLIPNILPQAIKSVEILEGDGGSGTIKLTTFGEGSQFKSVKHKVDGIDKENFTYGYSIIEGDALMGVLESISYEIKIEASPDGGSICKNSSKYYTKGDAQITEEQIKGGKEKASGMFKAVEAYLLANPDA